MSDTPQDRIALFRRAYTTVNGTVAPRVIWDGERFVWPKGHPMPPRTPGDFEKMIKRLVQDSINHKKQS